MKLLMTIFFNILILNAIHAQSEGVISYTETIKLDIQLDGMDEAMKKMFPESQSLQKELKFNNSESLYQNKKGEALEEINLSSDDGAMQIKIKMDDDVENILYKNLKEKNKTQQKGIMGKAFLVQDDLNNIKWKVTDEKIKYLDYECQKAVLENEDEFVVAWFSSQLPFQIGPGSYHGLPGAILMININDGETEIKANKIDLRTLGKDELQAPREGKKVNEMEFEKIQAEKEKEMSAMGGGRREIHRVRN